MRMSGGPARATIAVVAAGWRRAPLQLFTLLAGLALATALWAGVQAINSEARASYDAAAETLGEGTFDQLVARDGGPISQRDVCRAAAGRLAGRTGGGGRGSARCG